MAHGLSLQFHHLAVGLWKGCVTIISAEYDEAVVTQEFPSMRLTKSSLIPITSSWYCGAGIFSVPSGQSLLSTPTYATQSSDFENLTIFVPEDKEVQLRINAFVKDGKRDVTRKIGEYRDF